MEGIGGGGVGFGCWGAGDEGWCKAYSQGVRTCPSFGQLGISQSENEGGTLKACQCWTWSRALGDLVPIHGGGTLKSRQYSSELYTLSIRTDNIDFVESCY